MVELSRQWRRGRCLACVADATPHRGCRNRTVPPRDQAGCAKMANRLGACSVGTSGRRPEVTSRGKRKPANTEDEADDVTASVCLPAAIDQRNSAHQVGRNEVIGAFYIGHH